MLHMKRKTITSWRQPVGLHRSLPALSVFTQQSTQISSRRWYRSVGNVTYASLSFSISQMTVENGTSLFTYDTEFLLNNFFYGEKHSASFLPVFFPYKDPDDPLLKEMVLLCDSDRCPDNKKP